ncbi:BPSS1187 family protein [Deminuibacter soli]|uniref:Alpha/beta hydrolase n=1 Tax=Deminuibacter soli TaxID=2291815 RepID=A0A3E1NNM3_9BACT|nr:hypothetical protein [Deminuibacter soli]RFM29531.1 hypothetical protein DXN05_00665 [Deminuibacter soli]
MKLLQRGNLFGYSLLFLLFFCGSTVAQPVAVTVDPAATAPGIQTVHGAHLAMYSADVPQQNKLVLMIPGTNGTAAGCRVFDSSVAAMGYHVISIDYKNTVITTVCSNSTDNDCFDLFRREIILGTPVSSLVEVDSANSIVNRVTKLLQYLAANDAKGNWRTFLENGHPKWENIITVGHSQGAGHAAYLGKLFPVYKVLMLSGPQDYLVHFSQPAGWQQQQGVTPVSSYYAFLNRQDPFNMQYQLANAKVIMQTNAPDSLFVLPGEAVKGHPHILINDLDTKDHHGSTLDPRFVQVWNYVLTN